jgi:hypothetical protein
VGCDEDEVALLAAPGEEQLDNWNSGTEHYSRARLVYATIATVLVCLFQFER